ncbi:MAG: hypothetical protein ACOCQE_01005 [Halanaerobium sp.]
MIVFDLAPAKSISDVSWSRFVEYLEYKAYGWPDSLVISKESEE